MQPYLSTLVDTQKLGKKVYSSREMAIILAYKGSMQNINIWIKRLKDKGLIKQVKRGYYALANEEISNFDYSNILYAPSYISLDSALNFYGMLPQVPLNVTAITLKRAKVIEHEDVIYDYYHMMPNYYWGYDNVGGVLMADREKALVDKVYFEAFRNGFGTNFIDELNLEEVSFDKFTSYASKIKNEAFSRLIKKIYVKF